MKTKEPVVCGYLRRFCLVSVLTVGLALVASGSPGVAQSVDPDAIAGNPGAVSQLSPSDTTVAYVVQFYPLWFTYYQSQLAFSNRNNLVGPNRISPIYHYVVAINVDTLYASTYLDLSAQPVVLTIPESTPPFTSYSILMLDPYGDLLDANPPIPPMTPGSYALIGPGGFTGTLPQGVTPIEMPLDFSALIFRADKFSSAGQDQSTQANDFRKALTTQTLSNYDPLGGTATKIVPEIFFSVPFKTTADDLIAHDPIAFLRQLQRAVESDHTPPPSPYEEALRNRFNSLFPNNANRSEFSSGAQAAHELILDRYFTFTHWTSTPTYWIHFTDIGDWGNQVVERSAITEFIQYANNIQAAAYYHVFKDANGNPLDGSDPRGYVMTFPQGPAPEADRFWSVTAYTPEAIELVPNLAGKYAVASYTPGLQPPTTEDGPVSIYMARQLPAGVPMANWLPIPPGAFNIMLRVYGPTSGGTVADNTFVPPGIKKR
jgi:hypothetical protein